MEAGAGFKVLFILFTEDTASAAGTDKCSIVSKVSEILNENIVMSTSGSLDMSVNRLAMPPSFEYSQESCRQSLTCSVKLVVSCGEVTPKRNTDQGCCYYGDQDRALYFQCQQDDGKDQADKEYPKLRAGLKWQGRNSTVKGYDTDIQGVLYTLRISYASLDGMLQAEAGWI